MPALAILAALVVGIVQPTHAQITGFSNSTFTINHGTASGDNTNAAGYATITGSTLALTNPNNSEANSAVFNTKLTITGFIASFVYTDTVAGSDANGATFSSRTMPWGPLP